MAKFQKRLLDPWDYQGRVLDGPMVGEWVKHDSPYFDVLVYPIFPIVKSFTEQLKLEAAVETKVIVYKWLPSLRAWAWDQKYGYYPNASR